MPPAPHRFSDLDTVVDDLHALFEAWEGDGTYAPPLDDFSLQVMKLAVHEWIANLVQHADFESRAPQIAFSVHPNGRRVQCVIEDNSAGFDFERQLDEQDSLVRSSADAERGRGLLMMIACTEDMRYEAPPTPRDADIRQRLEFWISATPAPCLDIPF